MKYSDYSNSNRGGSCGHEGKCSAATPILKWAGGKRQALRHVMPNIPNSYAKYYEPFVGGGAVLLSLRLDETCAKVMVSDVNEELINVYLTIKHGVEELINELTKHKNDEKYYYSIRNLDRDGNLYSKINPIQRAARTIYLNRTCYNGLFRVNKKNQFNVPFGYYRNPNIVDAVMLRNVCRYLNATNAEILCCDFEEALSEADEKSFVYLDPPYDPLSRTSRFTQYSKVGFEKDEQMRLKNVCDKLNAKKVKFLMSNSATPFILDLYKGYEIECIKGRRSIGSDENGRKSVDELLIKNY